MHHIIPNSLSEFELVEQSPIQPLFGPPLNFSDFPTNIQDEDILQNTSRLARQIATPSGSISILSSVLVPLDAKKAIEDAGFPVPEVPTPSTSLFAPLESLLEFLSARNDLIVLRSIVSSSERLRDFLASSDRPPHLFAPNDFAFVDLVKMLLPGSYSQITGNVEEALVNVSRSAAILQAGGVVGVAEALGDGKEVEQFHDRLAALLKVVQGIPTLDDLLLYHMLDTSLSIGELVAAGPQLTLLIEDDASITEINVAEQGVIDDSERAPSNVIASLATRNGFVTVLDSVLLPLTIDEAKDAIIQSIGTPEPDEEFSSEPADPEEFPAEEPTDPEKFPAEEPPDQPVIEESPFTVPPLEEELPECFPSSSRVRLIDGTDVRMDELNAGAHVRVGDGTTSKVFLFTHRQPNVTSTFVRISTASGHCISLTPGHYMHVNGRLTAAASVRVGDSLDTEYGSVTVELTERVRLFGLYAPHTVHGDIMVDGIRVSCYSTAVQPNVAQALLSPLRYLAENGLNEPLGNLFYRGANSIATILPRGSPRL